MSHTHEESASSYYLEQLCMIAVGGALGLGAIVISLNGSLENLVVSLFQTSVLLGGIALVAVVAVRAVALWQSVGQAGVGHDHHHDHSHEHEHTHTHECGHDHSHEPEHTHDCGHEHHHDHDHHSEHAHDHGHEHEHAHAGHHHAHADHGHDHGFYPVRYVILLLPITLMFLRMPSSQFNKDYQQAKLKEVAGKLESQADNIELAAIQDKGGPVMYLDFKDLDRAGSSAESREFYEGKSGRIKGQFAPSASSNKIFTLVRFKMTCCAADAVPLKVVIVSPESITHVNPLDWVEVEGQIRFQQVRANEYMPVLQVASSDKVMKTDPAPSLYLQ